MINNEHGLIHAHNESVTKNGPFWQHTISLIITVQAVGVRSEYPQDGGSFVVAMISWWLPRWRATAELCGALHLARNRVGNDWSMSRRMTVPTRWWPGEKAMGLYSTTHFFLNLNHQYHLDKKGIPDFFRSGGRVKYFFDEIVLHKAPLTSVCEGSLIL